MDAHPLHIPEGINFSCSGCGNCCLHWPVPATDGDVARIPNGTFRRLLDSGEHMRVFTHTLEKRADGRCTFLSEDNRCRLHEEGGSEAKPAMCRLFPYSFTPTPSGIYLYVSFASSGVLQNFGTPLIEQQSEMKDQETLFHQLFPMVDDDWSKAQLIDGVPLPWQNYLDIEQHFFQALRERPLLDALIECSGLVLARLPYGTTAERMPPVEASPEDVDKILLNALSQLYFPEDVFAENTFDLDARALMTALIQPPPTVTICGGASAQMMLGTSLGRLPPEIEDLLYRWVYSRIFGKLFFSRSYAHLSLLSGVHHLFFFVAIIRMQMKLRIMRGDTINFWDVAEILRTGERRITQLRLSRESNTVLEILLSSPARLARVKSLAL